MTGRALLRKAAISKMDFQASAKRLLAIFSIAVILTTAMPTVAQDSVSDVRQQGLKGQVHFVKRVWYKPLRGGIAPDTSGIPDLGPGYGNSLTEYNADGMLRSATNYLPGYADGIGNTRRWYYTNERLTKRESTDPAGDFLSVSIYTNDSAGRQIREKTTTLLNGGDIKTYSMETTWQGNKKIRTTSREEEGTGEATQERPGQSETQYTYDTAGNLVQESHNPSSVFFRTVHSTYNARGRLQQTISRENDSNFYSFANYEYNSAGQLIRFEHGGYYKGTKTAGTVIIRRCNPQGDLVYHETTTNGHTRTVTTFHYLYDSQGNYVRKTWSKNGKPQMVEVIKLTYYDAAR